MRPNQTQFLTVISPRCDWLNSKRCDCPTLGSVFLEKVMASVQCRARLSPFRGKEGFAPSFLCAREPPAGEFVVEHQAPVAEPGGCWAMGRDVQAGTGSFCITDRSVFSYEGGRKIS